MARPYRLEGENCFYHITSRGNERKPIFREEGDYVRFLEYAVKAKERYGFYLYGYVLMTNHYHLLIETREANLSQIMQNINTSYATYHNAKYKRSGHLFQGRYKSIVVEKERHYLELSRYIHLNPLRAGMVKKPGEYKWSSYRGYLSSKGDGYIDKVRIAETMAISMNKYQEFVEDKMWEKIEPFKGLYGGFILGSARFIKGSLCELKDQVEGLKEVSYKRELRNRISKEQIIAGMERRYAKSIEELRNSKKRPMREKKMLIYLLRRFTGLTNREIGEVVGMKYAAVSMAGIKMEEEIRKDKKVKKEVNEIVLTFEG